jgi:hypothetical protein
LGIEEICCYQEARMLRRRRGRAGPPQVCAWYHVRDFPGLRVAVEERGAAWVFVHETPDGPYADLEALLFHWGLDDAALSPLLRGAR